MHRLGDHAVCTTKAVWIVGIAPRISTTKDPQQGIPARVHPRVTIVDAARAHLLERMWAEVAAGVPLLQRLYRGNHLETSGHPTAQDGFATAFALPQRRAASTTRLRMRS
eukprot:m.232738 g.232738  ORF g.232738 m.232738 type:complete len:110 (+) comp26066_c0_seq1:444-773(+)